VDLTVDDERYFVPSLYETPIVCELGVGRHTVRMLRAGRVLYAEEFAIAAGDELILTTWDGDRDGRCGERTDRAVARNGR
jgi:hypothetical protein